MHSTPLFLFFSAILYLDVIIRIFRHFGGGGGTKRRIFHNRIYLFLFSLSVLFSRGKWLVRSSSISITLDVPEPLEKRRARLSGVGKVAARQVAPSARRLGATFRRRVFEIQSLRRSRRVLAYRARCTFIRTDYARLLLSLASLARSSRATDTQLRINGRVGAGEHVSFSQFLAVLPGVVPLNHNLSLAAISFSNQQRARVPLLFCVRKR